MPARLALLTLLVATVAACDSSAPAIEVVGAVRDTTLRVQRDTLRINLRILFHHPDRVALQFGYTAGFNVRAELLPNRSTLQVVPLYDGRSKVSVEAIAPDGTRGTASFNVNSTSAWCIDSNSPILKIGRLTFDPKRDVRFKDAVGNPYLWRTRATGCRLGAFTATYDEVGPGGASTPASATITATRFTFSSGAVRVDSAAYSNGLTVSGDIFTYHGIIGAAFHSVESHTLRLRRADGLVSYRRGTGCLRPPPLCEVSGQGLTRVD